MTDSGVRAARWVVDVGARDLPVVVDTGPAADRPVVLVEAGAAPDPQSVADGAAGAPHGGADPLPVDATTGGPSAAGGWGVEYVGNGLPGGDLRTFADAGAFASWCRSHGLRTRPVGVALGGTLRRLAWVGEGIAAATTADPFTGRGTDAVPFDDAPEGAVGAVGVFGVPDGGPSAAADHARRATTEWTGGRGRD